MFNKILIANRGEIAVRIVRACHELGIRAVVAYSEADRYSLAVRMADEAVCIGPAPSPRSYLNQSALISAARITGCDAIHPGYGFLSENAYFAEICAQYGIKFIGPTPEAIRLMGDKAEGRNTMRAAGVPIVPGSEGELRSLEEAVELARGIGYPILLKPAGGGGGRGMRVANDEAELMRSFATAKSEAESAFGNGALLLEKYLPKVRHVEIQVLADEHGHAIHLGERDCSSQRRHQKIIEEAPSPAVSPELRARMGEAALKGVRAIGYHNAGTMEFLLDPDGNFYFIEMNTRIQVEHPVTELVTGVDLVRWQLRIASGEHLTIQQSDVQLTGHAIQCRINAEDPERDFMPSVGEIRHYLPSGGPGVRVDSHLYPGYMVPGNYDSLLAKLLVHAPNRDEAIVRMKRALNETVIEGVKTTIPFQLGLLDDDIFQHGFMHTRYVAEFMPSWLESRKK
ncbi:MAG: acetyl-CoA carboxylase biotin carboxylase subunit [Chloroflexota bacterium]|jgi:acetyl-CoA carboxylase biotin carboxylase subunit